MKHRIDYSQIPEGRRIEYLFRLKGYSKKKEFVELVNKINRKLNKKL